MKKITWFLALLFLFAAGGANAARFSAGDNVSVQSGETINTNFYAGGGNVNVFGKINGDSFLAGGTVESSGNITDDLNVAGGNVRISGEIGDDLRAAGGTINVNGRIIGESMAAGGQVQFSESSVVNGELIVAGGSVILNGNVRGNVRGNADKLEINGNFGGNINVVAGELVVGNNAVVSGTLSYKAPVESNIPASAKIGSVNFTQIEPRQKEVKGLAALIGIFWFVKLLSVILTALLIYAIFRRGSTFVVLRAARSFWVSILIGFITLIVLPIAMILVAVTVLGIPISFTALLIYLLFILLARIGAGVLLGTMLFKLFRRGSDYRFDWVTIVVGIVVMSLIGIIPFVGWLVSFIFFLAFFGQLFWGLYDGMRRIR